MFFAHTKQHKLYVCKTKTCQNWFPDHLSATIFPPCQGGRADHSSYSCGETKTKPQNADDGSSAWRDLKQPKHRELLSEKARSWSSLWMGGGIMRACARRPAVFPVNEWTSGSEPGQSDGACLGTEWARLWPRFCPSWTSELVGEELLWESGMRWALSGRDQDICPSCDRESLRDGRSLMFCTWVYPDW